MLIENVLEVMWTVLGLYGLGNDSFSPPSTGDYCKCGDTRQSYPACHSNLLCVFSAADSHCEFLQIAMPFLIVGFLFKGVYLKRLTRNEVLCHEKSYFFVTV